MSLFVSTTGVDVEIPELGITIVEPTVDRDLTLQFNSDEISKASSLTVAIQAGSLVWKKTAGGAAEPAADYDPDYTEVEELAVGGDDRLSQLVRRQGYRTSLEPQIAVDAFFYQITKNDHHIHRLNGGGPFATKPIYQLPDATTLDIGHQYIIINSSDGPVCVNNGAGIVLLDVLQTKRLFVYLVDNTTAAGFWDFATASGGGSVEGVAPVLAAYNGNANSGRYLEVFPGIATDEAPFLFPTNAIILAATAGGTTAPVNGQIGFYEISNLVTPRYTITLAGVSEQIDLNLNVPFSAGEKLVIKLNDGSTQIQKPRVAVYITGAGI